MKFGQRVVVFLCCCIGILVTISLVLTISTKEKIYDTVQSVRGALKESFQFGLRPEPNKFVRQLTAEEFRENPLYKTGNPLIDDYGKNSPLAPGEMGQAVQVPAIFAHNVSIALEKYQINVLASDMIPLNRMVPDSRFPGCKDKQYSADLPRVSIIVPFHDEWPSILYRTIYSVLNRTPRHLLEEIILIDDGSTLESLKNELDIYIATKFPVDLVRLVRLPERVGLIRARMVGVRQAQGEVLVIFDSHMEVNVQWLEPLLTQIKSDRKSIALGILDYVQPDTFLYDWHKGYLTRYGFDWRLVFFETFFRPDLYGPDDTVPKRGVVMVGAAFAVDRNYFLELGGYDEGMDVWGGENLELSWRTWLCGGSLIHLPCSKLGHIARVQPYSFPGGRRSIEVHNYKRAVELWMDNNHKFYIHDYFPEMPGTDAGNLTERLNLKKKLGCRSFSWFIENVWPELTVFDKNSVAWGAVRNTFTNLCLDNHNFLFTYAEPLYADPCHGKFNTQGLALTREGLLRSSLQCLVVKDTFSGARVMLEDCIQGPADKWTHGKMNEHIKHVKTGMCLDLCNNQPCVKTCSTSILQMWSFTHYV